MSKASKLYNSLSERQKQFVNEKTISATMSIRKWISLTNKAAIYDTYGDESIKQLMKYSIICFVLAFISIFLGALVSNHLFFGVVVFVLLGAVLLIMRKRMLSKDINDYLRLFFVPLLKVFANKAGEEAKMAATVDFNIPEKSTKPTTAKLGGKNLKMFQPKYIISKLTLLDGAILDFIIADDIKQFSWWKTSASGKRKHKTKTKFVHHAFIKLSLPISGNTVSNDNIDGVSIEETETSYIVKTKVKVKSEGKNKVLPLKYFFDAIQKAYSAFESKDGHDSLAETMEYDGDESLATAGVAAYMWSGGYFDSYDYDSFDFADSGSYDTDDDSATIFDS